MPRGSTRSTLSYDQYAPRRRSDLHRVSGRETRCRRNLKFNRNSVLYKGSHPRRSRYEAVRDGNGLADRLGGRCASRNSCPELRRCPHPACQCASPPRPSSQSAPGHASSPAPARARSLIVRLLAIAARWSSRWQRLPACASAPAPAALHWFGDNAGRHAATPQFHHPFAPIQSGPALSSNRMRAPCCR